MHIFGFVHESKHICELDVGWIQTDFFSTVNIIGGLDENRHVTP
jgi:hypothetical protein